MKLDFCYAFSLDAKPQLCIRVLTDLRHCDGVTAVRLALHTLEVVEMAGGRSGMNATSFKVNPPIPQSMWRSWNLIYELVCIVLDLLLLPWRCFWSVLTRGSISQNTPEGWWWYYLGKNYEPGELVLYAPDGNQFKTFQALVDLWRQELGLHRGFLYQLNYSPNVALGVVSNVSELNSEHVRVANAFSEPGPVQVGPCLHFLNMILQRTVMFNNYGRHVHSFEAKPTAFSWDWLNFPGKMSGAFAISINGVFLCGLRGIRNNVDHGVRLLKQRDDAEEECFGAGRRMAQVTVKIL